MYPDRPRSSVSSKVRDDLKAHTRAERADGALEAAKSRRIQEALDRMRLRAEAEGEGARHRDGV